MVPVVPGRMNERYVPMLPLAALRHEHRLLERLIRLLSQEVSRVEENIKVSPEFAFVNGKLVKFAVNFFQTYVDPIHHGKEEILFAALQDKPLPPELRHLLQELRAEHLKVRQAVAALQDALTRYLDGQETALPEYLEQLRWLVAWYPRHLAIEEQHFLTLELDYFSPEDQARLSARLEALDRDLDLTFYEPRLADWEAGGCKCHL